MTGGGVMKLFAHNHNDGVWLRTEQYCCPYHSALTGVCSASLTMMVVGAVSRRNYCENENYDNCAIFLSKMLRKAG
jgi:hypothetical protein